jgi:prepilin-type N-terminal cleavage/methylation domain-containing protein
MPVVSNKSGFTLVELSIVLVIIGLIAGGILGGTTLIRAAELRAVSSEFNAFQVAVNSFKNKYRALPGDMKNAHRFWGLLPGATEAGVCPTVGSTDDATCNGDGDGIVEFSQGEPRHVWKHLANAGLIAGQYTGEYITPQQPGITGPASKYGGGVWAWGASYWMYNLGWDEENAFVLGAGGGGYMDGSVDYPIFTVEDAWSLDEKMDDGMPEEGNVRAFNPLALNDCFVFATKEYNFAMDGNTCSMAFFFL